jgi:hypothetical protein
MNLSNVRKGYLKEVFDALEEAFLALYIDYYLIGALARDVWYAKGKKNFRTTKDADFAVLIGSKNQYEEVKQYLKQHKNFQNSRGNAFVIFMVLFLPNLNLSNFKCLIINRCFC